MGKNFGFESNKLFWNDDTIMNKSLSWSESDYTILENFWSSLQQGYSFIPSDISEIENICIRGIESPITRSDVIGKLMNPQCHNLLSDALKKVWVPGISPDLKEKLSKIALEPDEAIRITQMTKLVINDLQSAQDTPFEHKTHFIDLIPPQRVFRREKDSQTSIPESSEPPTSFDKLNKLFKEGNITEVKNVFLDLENPEKVFTDAGSEAWALLIELADDIDTRDLACELLYKQGENIIPTIEEISHADSYSRKVIEWIQTGEKLTFKANNNRGLSQVIDKNDMNGFKTLIEHVSERNKLVKIVIEQGDRIVPMLIDMLGDSDRHIQVFAMDVLHEQGNDAVNPLMEAKLCPNPEIRKNAELLLHQHFTGESFQEYSPFQDNNPFKTLNTNNLGSENAGTSSSFNLDVDYFTEKLSKPETCMETLNSLIQIGQPSMPTLCQILVNNRRNKSNVNV